MATEKVTYELSLRDLMSKGLGDINAKLGAMESKLASAEKTGAKTSSSLGSTFRALGAVFAGMKIGEIASELVQTTAKFQSLGNSIKFSSDTMTQGQVSLSWLENFSDKYGLQLEGATQGFKTFQGAMMGSSFTSNQVRNMFEQVSKGIVTMGLSADDAKGVFLALGQIQSKGTVSAEELRGQIGERVPGAFQIAARAMGVTTAALGDMMKKGELMSDVFLPKFAAEMEKTFGPGAEQAADNITSSINKLSSAWDNLLKSIGNSDTENIFGKTLNFLSRATNSLADSFKSVDEMSSKIAQPMVSKQLTFFDKGVSDIMAGGGSRATKEDKLKSFASLRLSIAEADLKNTTGQIRSLKDKLGFDGLDEKDGFKFKDWIGKFDRNNTTGAMGLLAKEKGLEQIIDGIKAGEEKGLSAIYKPTKAEEDLKKQSESVSGGVPKVVNINIEALMKDVKNYFGSGGLSSTEGRNFLDELQEGLNTIVTDVGIVAQYGR